MQNDSLIHLAVWLSVGSSVGLSAGAPPRGLNSMRVSEWLDFLRGTWGPPQQVPEGNQADIALPQNYVNHFAGSVGYK